MRTYKLITDDPQETIDLTMAGAYALETSGYIIPAPSTNEEWNFHLAKGITWDDVMDALRSFDKESSNP